MINKGIRLRVCSFRSNALLARAALSVRGRAAQLVNSTSVPCTSRGGGFSYLNVDDGTHQVGSLKFSPSCKAAQHMRAFLAAMATIALKHCESF